MLAAQESIMKFELEPNHRNVPDEELLHDLIRVAKELGKEIAVLADLQGPKIRVRDFENAPKMADI